MATARQQAWAAGAQRAAREGNELAAGLFGLLAQPNSREREHSCQEHAIGFSLDGRRGWRCGVCRTVLRWMDERDA